MTRAATGVPQRPIAAAIIATLMMLTFVIGYLTHPDPTRNHQTVPSQHREGGYAGSGACRACHPAEFDSWSQSYHRTMTRPSHELRWQGQSSPPLPADLNWEQRPMKIEKIGTEVLVTGPDLHQIADQISAGSADDAQPLRLSDIVRGASEVRRRIVMTTGSHHYLAFWVENGVDQELRQLPFVYLLSDQSWVPRRDAFLQPPDQIQRIARWNANCIQCHSVGGRPGQSEGYAADGSFWERYESDAVDLGISCEACHGPGQRHVAHFRNPLRRHETRFVSSPSSPATRDRFFIFVPGSDAKNRGSQACGQCHSYFLPKRPDIWWERGFMGEFAPGDALENSRLILKKSQTDLPLSVPTQSLFWSDGGIIVGGREYNGLVESPCNTRDSSDERLSCTSCHSMHASFPDGQLKREYLSTPSEPQRSDLMCTQCHNSMNPEHSRHQPDSPGARCVNCHMPRSSYALLSGIASHFISSPDFSRQPSQCFPEEKLQNADPSGAVAVKSLGTASASAHAPHACALCHVDQSRARLVAGWQTPGQKPGRTEEERTTPWAVERALCGNAAERALYAAAMGASSVPASSKSSIVDLTLGVLAADPYAAVRRIALRSLSERTQLGALALPLDTPDRDMLLSRLKNLHDARDQTPITIAE